jgi:AcrR family transcriptional regulator
MVTRDQAVAAIGGRPRSERAKSAILKAAGELLVEQGLRAMTVESVARRAGVSKKTIYRWWPNKGILALDAFYEDWSSAQQDLTPDTGTLLGDLRRRARATVRLMTSERLGPVFAALLGEAQGDDALADAVREHVLEPLRAQARAIFRRAIARGELRADTDVEVAIDLFQGPLFLRLLYTRSPLQETFADQIAEMALNGVLPRGAQTPA